MAFPVAIGLLLAGGFGAGVGALSRQPEINRLKAQVKILQEEISRLQLIVREQDRQIKELKIRYKALRAYSFIERKRQKLSLKGAIMFQYSVKEYIELLDVQARNSNFQLQQEEAVFFNIFEKMINNQAPTVEEKMFLREYIRYKYSNPIDNLTEYDMDSIIEKVENINVA